MNFLDSITSIGGLIGIVSAWIASLFWVYRAGINKERNSIKLKTIEKRFRYIYVPLRKLLMDKHITKCSAVLPSKLSDRFNRALPMISNFKIKSVFQILFGKYRTKPIVEVEFGGRFPFEEIKKVVSSSCEYADAEILSLVESADRSKYELRYESEDESGELEGNILTEEESELADYIYEEYYRLNKKYFC